VKEEEEEFFEKIAKKLCKKKEITIGKMMSTTGLKYKNKVFAFYYNKRMVFRLGKEFDIDKENLKDWKYLSPFKKKAPMKGWFDVGFSDKERWEDLALKALGMIKRV
jgi:hypothetical protein